MERTIKIIVLSALALVLFAIIQLIVEFKFDRLSENQPSSENVISTVERERQLECLAMNIYREAGYEDFEGKVAVAQVTMNRVAHSKFPNDVCEVVYEKNNFSGRIVCQFSWYCDHAHRNRKVSESGYTESYEVAVRVLLEGFRLPVLNDAIFYHADYVHPNWRYERIQQIGRHIFYREQIKEFNNDV